MGKDRFEDYVTVAERIEQFYSAYPAGRILTAIVEHDREAGFALIRAEVYRTAEDTMPSATGHAFEIRGESYVNKTSYLENCETSSVGRALALLGFEVRRGIAAPHKPTPPRDAESEAAHGKLDKEIKQAYSQYVDAREKAREQDKTLKPLPDLIKAINSKFKVGDGLNSLSLSDKESLLADIRLKMKGE